MGEVAEGIAASCRGTGNNGLSSCEAQNVASIPQEDCGSAAGTVGEGEGGEEGCLTYTSEHEATLTRNYFFRAASSTIRTAAWLKSSRGFFP